MWELKGTPADAKRFAPFEPVRVLNYYDGPRIFTVLDADGSLCLACWSDEDETRSRFLVAPVTAAVVADLESGRLTVREALGQPRLWVVDLSHDGPIAGAWLVNRQDVPNDAQPQPRATLRHAASLRAAVHAVRPAEIPERIAKGTAEVAPRD